MSGGRPRPDLCERQVHYHHCHRNDIVFAACQQRRIFGQLSRIDLACGDPPEDVVGTSKLFALAVLPTGKFDACPDAVLRRTLAA